MVALGAALAAPNVVALDRVSPIPAIAVLTSALAIRALVSLAAAFLVVLLVPHWSVLEPMTRWCWDAVVHIDGHLVSHLVTLVPISVLGVSLVRALVRVRRVARGIGNLLDRHAVGTGPRRSVIVEGPDVVLASAGFARPRVFVSAGALIEMDDDELAAGLAHEYGHIARGHRFVLLFGELCRGLGRFVPGGRRAGAELMFHLERDADQWALSQRHDPLALARAIAKASGRAASTASRAALDGGFLPERLRQLVGQSRPAPRSGPARALAGAMVAIALALLASTPATGAAGLAELGRAHTAEHCEE